MNPKLLIVDDDEEIRTQMKWALAEGLRDCPGRGPAPARWKLSARTSRWWCCWILGLPPHPADPEEGLAALSELLALDRLAKVIVITGQGEKGIALRAIGGGAYDFLAKPVEMEELKFLLKRCFHVAQLEREYARHAAADAAAMPSKACWAPARRCAPIFDTIRKVATTDAPVLILGESGTGKEMAAQAIHQRSARKNGPFVAINCSAIPGNAAGKRIVRPRKRRLHRRPRPAQRPD